MADPVRYNTECILVDDKKYCEVNDLSVREMAFSVLMAVVIAAYIAFFVSRILDNPRSPFNWMMVFAPFLLMIIFGGR